MEAAGEPQNAAEDVKQLERSLKDQLRGLNWKLPRPGAICRVPTRFREHDPSAYDPIAISLGPFHKDKLVVQAAKRLKLRFLEELLLRCPMTNLCDPLAALTAQVKETRGQYSEEFPETTDTDFVEMLVVDGCFILELMFKKIDHPARRVALPRGEWAISDVMNDLFLLENQIPFSVLQTLYSTLRPRPFHFDFSLRGLVFHSVIYPGAPPSVIPDGIEDRQFHHLVHFYQYCHVPQCKREDAPPRSSWLQGVPSVTQLMDAGVKFKRKELSTTTTEYSYSDLGITFSSDGVFEIPSLFLHGGSNSKLRNLIAFEQSCDDIPEEEHYYTSHCLLMHYLMNTERDLEVLKQLGIVYNYDNIVDAAILFDNVSKEVSLYHVNNCYLRVLEDVTLYCASEKQRWRARLTRDYFSSRLTCISAVLIVFYFIRTFYIIYGYYRPRH